MKRFAFVLLALASIEAAQGPRTLKPGWNLFSKEQDIQLGKEAAAEIEKQVTVVSDSELNRYLRRIGEKLAAAPEAGGFPYSFKLVSDNTINAFALPGGPTYIHSGLIAAAENEAQLAGVIAHEIAHVALRHGTNQASKANLIQLPAALAAAAAGGSGSMLGSLAQLGIGLGANSILLKYSRNAERDADLLGTRIMARAGYTAVEMARFFEKLEAGGGSRMPQFFSDHPNPGNRIRAVEAEIRYLPSGTYTTGNAAEFANAKSRVASLPPPPARAKSATASSAPPAVPEIQVSGRFREHRSQSYTISYPDNWQVAAGRDNEAVSVAPPEGLVQGSSGTAIGIGSVAGFHVPAGGRKGLRTDSEDLVRSLISSNPGMKLKSWKDIRVAGQAGRLATLQSSSPYANAAEIDNVVTVDREQGLFYLVLIAPQPSMSRLDRTFDAMIRSIRFTR
jgi:predicted Zn-dependent protease